MTLLYHDERFLLHETGPHPERPTRLEAIDKHLEREGLIARCQRPAWQPATPAMLETVHDPTYVQEVQRYAAAGGGKIEVDTVVSPESYRVAALAAGAALDAVRRVLAGEDTTALCLSRPPGHHALSDAPMGFCLFGNVAIAARTAIDELGLNRVLIVDWDVHHGNGTQAMFWEDERVAFFSSHRYPFYPGTGAADETGAGQGLGATLNLPLEFGVARSEFISRFGAELERFADKIKPELVLVSAGFDAHREDPVGSLSLESEDFGTLTEIVRNVAQAHSGGKIVSVLEGGYNPARLAESVSIHLRVLLESTGALGADK
jgi:acetoin utilization deacetylase AcuC-like enzyme